MNKLSLGLLAAATAVALAGCVPSQYGYGNYGGYSPYGSRSSNPYYGGSRTNPYYGGTGYGSGGYSRPTLSSDGTFRCESEDRRLQRCLVDTRGGVALVRQESDASCIEGRTWGVERDGVWVSNGCRARFAVRDSRYGSGGYYGRDAQTVRCESQDGRRDICGLPFRARSVTLSRQLSDTRCSQGYNWGWSGDTVWVDRGCRGEFVARY